jgi:hypothetical protein
VKKLLLSVNQVWVWRWSVSYVMLSISAAVCVL